MTTATQGENFYLVSLARAFAAQLSVVAGKHKVNIEMGDVPSARPLDKKTGTRTITIPSVLNCETTTELLHRFGTCCHELAHVASGAIDQKEDIEKKVRAEFMRRIYDSRASREYTRRRECCEPSYNDVREAVNVAADLIDEAWFEREYPAASYYISVMRIDSAIHFSRVMLDKMIEAKDWRTAALGITWVMHGLYSKDSPILLHCGEILKNYESTVYDSAPLSQFLREYACHMAVVTRNIFTKYRAIGKLPALTASVNGSGVRDGGIEPAYIADIAEQIGYGIHPSCAEINCKELVPLYSLRERVDAIKGLATKILLSTMVLPPKEDKKKEGGDDPGRNIMYDERPGEDEGKKKSGNSEKRDSEDTPEPGVESWPPDFSGFKKMAEKQRTQYYMRYIKTLIAAPVSLPRRPGKMGRHLGDITRIKTDLRVFESRKRVIEPHARVSLLLDNSGSMDQVWESVHREALALTKAMEHRSVKAQTIVFNGNALEVKYDELSRTRPRGGTNLGAALAIAKPFLGNDPTISRACIVFTDGVTSHIEKAKKLTQMMLESGVKIVAGGTSRDNIIRSMSKDVAFFSYTGDIAHGFDTAMREIRRSSIHTVLA